jgi:hypothetical protein
MIKNVQRKIAVGIVPLVFKSHHPDTDTFLAKVEHETAFGAMGIQHTS